MKTNCNIDLFLTAEDMLHKPETIRRLADVGADINSNWIKKFHAKTKNYKPNTYYRVKGVNGSYAGMGNGLYLGKNREALVNFYGMEDESKEVIKFMGNPHWLNLMDYDKYSKFEKSLAKKNITILNSNRVSKVVSEMGFDGIRYYDPQATGEEYVLFNTKKVREIKIVYKTSKIGKYYEGKI